MNDLPLEIEILYGLILLFISFSMLIFLFIVSRKLFLKYTVVLQKTTEQKYLGYLTNAIDSKVQGEERDYELHVTKIKKALGKKAILRMVKSLLLRLEESISGVYLSAANDLKSKLNLNGKWHDEADKHLPQLGKLHVSFNAFSEKKGLANEPLMQVLGISSNTLEQRNRLSEMDKIRIFEALSNYPMESFPDLGPAMKTKNIEALRFIGEIIGRFKLTNYLNALIATLKDYRSEGNAIIRDCLQHFRHKNDLKSLQGLMMSCHDYETKKYIVEHIKRTCLR